MRKEISNTEIYDEAKQQKRNLIEEARERVEIKKGLFKAILSLMLDQKLQDIPAGEIIRIVEASIKSFKNKYF